MKDGAPILEQGFGIGASRSLHFRSDGAEIEESPAETYYTDRLKSLLLEEMGDRQDWPSNRTLAKSRLTRGAKMKPDTLDAYTIIGMTKHFSNPDRTNPLDDKGYQVLISSPARQQEQWLTIGRGSWENFTLGEIVIL